MKMSYISYYELLGQYQDRFINKHRNNNITIDRIVFLQQKLNEWANQWDNLYTESFQ